MFTGIIAQVGTIIRTEKQGSNNRFVVRVPRIPLHVKAGSSVAVSGVCLTVVAKTKTAMTFDAVEETLKKTTLGKKKRGESVNIEFSLRVGDEIGGHLVYGHVDLTVKIINHKSKIINHTLIFALPKKIKKFIVPQGSVAIDGVSLTVVNVGKNTFSVALVPYTLAHTTLRSLKKGDWVNVECDMLAKYAARLLSPP
ncbi:MAG: riboflavin synthase [Patescibacteria group bacterium]